MESSRSFSIPQISLLEGKSNWENWRAKVRMALKIIPKAINIIDGIYVCPEPPGNEKDEKASKNYSIEFNKFNTVDNQALLVMSNNMTEEMFQKVRRYESAHSMWVGLCQLFDTFSEDRIFDLYNTFFESRWLPEEDAVSFIARLSNCWNQLQFEINKQPEGNKDVLLICKILKSLPDKFKSFAAGWRLINQENKSLENLTQKLCTFESNLLEQTYILFQIFRYLKGTLELGITYKKNHKKGFLECYSDADHGGDKDTGRSTTGIVCLYSGGAISWFSKRQTSVSISTTEAEVIAASEGTREMIWLKRLLQEITDFKEGTLFVDNNAAIKLAENPVWHKRTKHIAIRHFFVREKVQEGEIKIRRVDTQNQLADGFTKPLPSPRQRKLNQDLGLS